jgi:secreted protein with Ig-like and vWFA domain
MNTLSEPADPKALATAYALGELTDTERADFERLMENDPALAALAGDTKDFCALLDTTLREPVPSLAEENRVVLLAAAARKPRKSVIWIPWLAGAAAACVAGGIWYQSRSGVARAEPEWLGPDPNSNRRVPRSFEQQRADKAARELASGLPTAPSAAGSGLKYQPQLVTHSAPVSEGPPVTIKPEMPKPLFAGTPLPDNNPPANLDRSGKPVLEVQVPAGVALVSKGKPVTCSDSTPLGELSWVTDGDKNGDDGYFVDILPGLHWVQIDLGVSQEIHLIWMWHYHKVAAIYKDVVVQISDDPEFKTSTTIFNNDWDNSAGFGIGKDPSYVETNNGRAMPVQGVTGRFVRCWSNGRNIDDTNHYIEVEVYGRQPAAVNQAALAGADAAKLQELMLQALEMEREGDERHAKQDFASAIERYRSALQTMPGISVTVPDRNRVIAKYSNTSILHARELGQRGQFEKAKVLVAAVLDQKIAPGHPGAQLLQKQLEDPARFRQEIAATTAAQSEEVTRLLNQGLAYYDLGQFNEAEIAFNKALGIDPYNTAARRQLERTQREVSSYLKAARDETRLRMLSEADSTWDAAASSTAAPTVTVKPAMPKPLFAGTPLPDANPPPNLERTGWSTPAGTGRTNLAVAGGLQKETEFYTDLNRPERATESERRAEYRFIPAEAHPGTESYKAVVENPFLKVGDAPLSTFSIDVDTASYSNVRRFLNMNQAPPPAAVRLEELVNYFPYEYAQPVDGKPFAVHVEMTSAPWDANHRLARIALKGKEIHHAERPAANLVFLVDVSGSMQPENKLPLVKQSLRFVVERLSEKDTVSLVTHAGESGVALPATNGADKARIMAAIDGLGAGGSTNGAGGITTAYQQAAIHFNKEGINRVILATDGDFNVGVTSHDDLLKLIEEKRKTGVFLSLLGYGMGNTKDDTMELLANKGNGNYAYIDSLSEARKALGEQFSGTLVTIAKDVKIQIEFNPAVIRSYRLLGYENRMLAKEDFTNDLKDAGEIGAGHTVTALYELVPVGAPEPRVTVDDLKYAPKPAAEPVPPLPAVPAEISGETMTVKLRWKAPDSDVSTPMEVPVKDTGAKIEAASQETKWAVAVAGFAAMLNGSQFNGLTWDGIRALAKAGKGADPNGYRGEFLQLIDRAESVTRR